MFYTLHFSHHVAWPLAALITLLLFGVVVGWAMERITRGLGDVPDTKALGILLVEHDMSLVMAICAHIYVLDFRHLIFGGTASDTQASELVRSAYLGSEAVEAAR